MEWIIFGLLFWFFFLRSKNKQKKKLRRHLDLNSGEQKQYDAFLKSLPALSGDGSFGQEIRGEQAYKEDIDLLGQYIQQFHPGEDVVLLMVAVEPENKPDKHAVRIEAGKATLGYIPREQALEFSKELNELGGKATCDARFYWSPNDGRSSITLDVVRPLRISRT